MNKVTAEVALKRLKDGNERYLEELISVKNIAHSDKRVRLVDAQTPFAIILSCSDSRVPSEIVFDQGLGDLFVVRVAGNIVAPSIIGSVEFASSKFGTALVVVLGHSNCGAVSAALEAQLKGQAVGSENIQDIVDRISPSIVTALNSHKKDHLSSSENILDRCIRVNIETSVRGLKENSKIISTLVAEGKLKIVGAEYCLETGKVSFFDEEETKNTFENKKQLADFIKGNHASGAENVL
jgi:carbonic anhydrase